MICLLMMGILIKDLIMATPTSSSIPRLPVSATKYTLSSRRYFLPRHIKDSAEVFAEVSQTESDGLIPKHYYSVYEANEYITPSTTTTLPPKYPESKESGFGTHQLLDLYNRLGKILGLQHESVEEYQEHVDSLPTRSSLRESNRNLFPDPTSREHEFEDNTLEEETDDRDRDHYRQIQRPTQNTKIQNRIAAQTRRTGVWEDFPKPEQILSHSFSREQQNDYPVLGRRPSVSQEAPGPENTKSVTTFNSLKQNRLPIFDLHSQTRRNSKLPNLNITSDYGIKGSVLPNRVLSLLRHSRFNKLPQEVFPLSREILPHSQEVVPIPQDDFLLSLPESSEVYEVVPKRTSLRVASGIQRIGNLRERYVPPIESYDEFDNLLELKPIDESIFSKLILPRQEGGNLVRRPKDSQRLKATTIAPTTTTTTQPTTTTTVGTTTAAVTQRKSKRRRKRPTPAPQPTVEFSIDELKQLLLATSGTGIDRSELIKAAYYPYVQQQVPPLALPRPPPIPLRPIQYAPRYGDYFYDSGPPPFPFPRKSKQNLFKSYAKSPKEGLADTSTDYGNIGTQLSELSAILTPAPAHYEDYYDDYSFFPISPKKFNAKIQNERKEPPDPFVTVDGKKADEIAGNLLSRYGLNSAQDKQSESGIGSLGEVNNHYLSPSKVFNTFQKLFETIFSAAPPKEVGPQLKDIPQPAPFTNSFGFQAK